MHTIAGQLADVGGAEATGGVGPQVQVLVSVPHGAHAGGKAVEVALESLEAHVTVIHQLTAVEMAVVKTKTSVQRPSAHIGRRRDKGAEVKQTIVGNQELVTLVERTLGIRNSSPSLSERCHMPLTPLVMRQSSPRRRVT